MTSELLYAIDPNGIGQHGALTIRIQEGARCDAFLQAIKEQRRLTKKLLSTLSTTRDAALIPFLIQAESDYVKKTSGFRLDLSTVAFNVVRILPSSLLEAFKLFVMNGKLYFNEKALVIDLYGKSQMHYLVDRTLTKTSIHGRLLSNGKEIDLASVSYIGKGPPHWYIDNIILKFISNSPSWNEFKKCYAGELIDVESLLQNVSEDPEAPSVIFKEDSTSLTLDPLPVLYLTDRTGGFANLYMDYGQDRILVLFDGSLPMEYSFEKTQSKRMLLSEQGWEKDLLETGYMRKKMASSHYYCPLDQVSKSIAFLLEIGWRVYDFKGNLIAKHQGISFSISESQKALIVKGKIQYEGFAADLSTIIGAFTRRERFVEIAPGRTVLLPEQWEEPSLEALIAEGELIQDELHLKREHFGIVQTLCSQHAGTALDPALQNLQKKMQGFNGIDYTAARESFKGSLRPYQQQGVNWLAFLHQYGFHGLLADEMGLGKTVQVLAFLSTIDVEEPILIVVPTSLIFNWKREFQRFLPNQTLVIHHGPKRLQCLNNLGKGTAVLTSYHTLRSDLSLFAPHSFSCLILDEAQLIKNARSQLFQSVCQLHAKFRLSMSGTPIENSMQELWTHFHFLIPGLLGEETVFSAELQAGLSDTRYFNRIKKIIKPFMLRRKKEEVAKELPEKIEQIVWVEMNERQRAFYEDFLMNIKSNLMGKVKKDGASKHRMEILESILRLRQICCDPLLICSIVDPIKWCEPVESSKLELLIQEIESILEGDKSRKILIYSQFTSMLSLISKKVRQKGWKHVLLDGSTKDREKVVLQFQEDPSVSLFLISLKAGGVGLNLTAADYVFIYDPWWNEAVENQAINRAHRMGRKEVVIAKRYIVAESIEEKILKLKQVKSEISSYIIEEQHYVDQLSGEDLLFLLN